MPDNGEFINSLTDATLQIVRDMAGKVDQACLIVEADAKKKCPVDMGVLRASVNHEVETTHTEITGMIGSNLEYAPYVHQGTGIYAVGGDGRKTPWGYTAKTGKYKGYHITRGQRPQPFLTKAVIENRAKIERVLSS